MEYKIFLYRISVSFILSLLIGLERQIRGRAIGLRTSVLVSIGTFMFVSFSIQMNAYDVTRIASQVVSGIGFLGAGAIIKDGTNIKGLNTAATLWCNAAIGVLCAGGLIVEAAIGACFILFCNIILRYFTSKAHLVKQVQIYDDYVLKITCEGEISDSIREKIMNVFNKTSVLLISLETKEQDLGQIKITSECKVINNKSIIIENLMNEISSTKGVINSSLRKIDQEKVTSLDDDEV